MATFTAAASIKRVIDSSERPAIGPQQNIIGLGSGDPDFRTPEHIRQAMIDAVNEGWSNYPPGNGDPELLAAISALIEQRSGHAWDPNAITITNGGSGAIFASMAGYLDPSDRVLIPEPTFSQYRDVATLCGAEVVFVTQTEDFHLDLDNLRAAAQQHAPKMLVLNSPNNPTGVVYSRAELEGAAEIAREFNMLVIADEVYDNLVFDDTPFVSALEIPAFHDRLLYLQSFSKTYAMTGWRMGYVAAGPGLLPPVARMARITGGGVNWAMQRAGIAAVTGPTEPTTLMREEYAARRELVGELLDGAEGVSWTPPGGAFYAFIKYDADVPSRQMAKILLDRGVAIRSGTEFGPSGQGYVRVAFATDRASLTKGMLIVRETLEEAVAGKLAVGV